MKVFITGINGFIGYWLSRYLLEKGYSIVGLTQKKQYVQEKNIRFYPGNILDFSLLKTILQKEKPRQIFHLAAQSNIPYSFFHPQETIHTNVNGTLNLFEAVRSVKLKTDILSVGSSSEYGVTALSDHLLSEEAPLIPTNPYAVSKMTQGYMCQIYKKMYGLHIIHVRPFAVIGQNKTGDVLSDFVRCAVAIENGKRKKLLVGITSHKRDFIDVRDAVYAMDTIINRGEAYDAYNICTGIGTEVQKLLEIVLKNAKKKIVVEYDSKKYRKIDDPIIVGNPSRLFSLGFQPRFPIEKTIFDVLNFWRENSLISKHI